MTAATDALRAAMKRLLAGEPERTDGALTHKNLYLEAAVSRATMNRAEDVLQEWRAAVSEVLRADPDARKPMTPERTLKRDLRKARKKVRKLNAQLDAAASLIAALVEDNRHLRNVIAQTPDATLTDLQERRIRGTASSHRDPSLPPGA